MVWMSFASQIVSINGANLLTVIRLSYHQLSSNSIFRSFSVSIFCSLSFYSFFSSRNLLSISKSHAIAIYSALFYSFFSSFFSCPLPFYSLLSIRSFFPSYSDIMCWIWFSHNVCRIDIRHWLLILTMMNSQCLALTSIFSFISLPLCTTAVLQSCPKWK